MVATSSAEAVVVDMVAAIVRVATVVAVAVAVVVSAVRLKIWWAASVKTNSGHRRTAHT